MATKVELQAELESLKTELARYAKDDKKVAPDDQPTSTAQSKPDTQKLKQLLGEHGVDVECIESIGSDFLAEITEVQKDKPIITLVVAFALGVIAGRASK